MLAYVFWHWKRPDASALDYEERLRAFHRALSEDPPNGFHRSASFALHGAPWANEGNEAYEDWYLLDGSADLDRLNEAAVTTSRKQAHDQAAAVAGGGTAGLYRLRLGALSRRPLHAHWFAKPADLTYAQLFDQLGLLVERYRCALWMRQMTLGPAAEFCLHAADAEPVVPRGLVTRVLPLRTVWPGEA